MTMLPTEEQIRVGVQALTIWPWNGIDGPYDETTAEHLWGIKEVGISKEIKSVQAHAGNTVHPVDEFEEERKTKLKVAYCKGSLRFLQMLFGGTFLVNPPQSGLIPKWPAPRTPV